MTTAILSKVLIALAPAAISTVWWLLSIPRAQADLELQLGSGSVRDSAAHWTGVGVLWALAVAMLDWQRNHFGLSAVFLAATCLAAISAVVRVRSAAASSASQ